MWKELEFTILVYDSKGRPKNLVLGFSALSNIVVENAIELLRHGQGFFSVLALKMRERECGLRRR
jgi:hypothetical protein